MARTILVLFVIWIASGATFSILLHHGYDWPSLVAGWILGGIVGIVIFSEDFEVIDRKKDKTQ